MRMARNGKRRESQFLGGTLVLTHSEHLGEDISEFSFFSGPIVKLLDLRAALAQGNETHHVKVIYPKLQ